MKFDITALLARTRALRKELDELEDVIREIEEPQPVQVQSVNQRDGYMTAKDLAKYFKVSTSTIYEWVNRNILPCGTLFGERQTRWKLSEVEAKLNENKKSHDASKSRRSRQSKIHNKEDFSV